MLILLGEMLIYQNFSRLKYSECKEIRLKDLGEHSGTSLQVRVPPAGDHSIVLGEDVINTNFIRNSSATVICTK